MRDLAAPAPEHLRQPMFFELYIPDGEAYAKRPGGTYPTAVKSASSGGSRQLHYPTINRDGPSAVPSTGPLPVPTCRRPFVHAALLPCGS